MGWTTAATHANGSRWTFDTIAIGNYSTTDCTETKYAAMASLFSPFRTTYRYMVSVGLVVR